MRRPIANIVITLCKDTQGSDSKSNSRLSASSISNNSELMKTAHHFIGDVLKLGNENAKNNENV